MDLKKPKPEFAQKSANQTEAAVEEANERAEGNMRELEQIPFMLTRSQHA